MVKLPLPLRSASLSQAGFQKVYKWLQENPPDAKVLAKEIEKDPIGILELVFRLTERQKARYESIGNEELRKRVRLLIDELGSGSLRPLRLNTGRSAKHPDGREDYICATCFVLMIESS